MVLQDVYCKTCGEVYTDTFDKMCKSCRINDLKNNFTNWTSGNEKIDNLIQEMQLKINNPTDRIFEWIPYDQFNDIKEIGRGGYSKVYSAIWEDGSLCYNYEKNEYTRNTYEIVALKCLYNSQNITNEFLNEV